MYIRRKVFSVLDTEEGERLFSTTDYILDQREFAGETKRRNKALKRQYLEKMAKYADSDKQRLISEGKSQFINDLEAASKLSSGRTWNRIYQGHDELAWKGQLKKRLKGGEPYESPLFKEEREEAKQKYMNKKNKKLASQSPKPTTPNPEVVVSSPKPVSQPPKPTTPKPVVASNPNPEVIKTESKLSRLAKNKYVRPTSNPEAEAAVSKKAPVSKEASFTPKKASVAPNSKPTINKSLIKSAKDKTARRVGVRTAAGLLALGGTAAGGYYLLNKKNKKDKEDKE